jgi:flagellar motor switch protein FliG
MCAAAATAAPSNANAITGARKAAIALLSLDEELASQVLAKMSLVDVRKLSEAVEDLGEVGSDMISTVLEDLERGLSDPMLMARAGGGAYMRKLADRAFGSERASKALGIEAPNPEPLQLLRTARVSALAQLLADEHPQIASVVLTQLPARIASKVLALMDKPIAADLTARISALDEIPEHAVTEASESLVRALDAVGGLASSDTRADFDGLAFSAAIINELPSADGDDLLASISERDEQTATKIREALFTFEDLLRIPPRELANVLRAVQADQVVVALQTASTELKEHILSALSQRAAATLRDDMSSAAPKRLSEVEAAEREIVDAVLRLAAEGKITMPQRGSED